MSSCHCQASPCNCHSAASESDALIVERLRSRHSTEVCTAQVESAQGCCSVVQSVTAVPTVYDTANPAGGSVSVDVSHPENFQVGNYAVFQTPSGPFVAEVIARTARAITVRNPLVNGVALVPQAPPGSLISVGSPVHVGTRPANGPDNSEGFCEPNVVAVASGHFHKLRVGTNTTGQCARYVAGVGADLETVFIPNAPTVALTTSTRTKWLVQDNMPQVGAFSANPAGRIRPIDVTLAGGEVALMAHSSPAGASVLIVKDATDAELGTGFKPMIQLANGEFRSLPATGQTALVAVDGVWRRQASLSVRVAARSTGTLPAVALPLPGVASSRWRVAIRAYASQNAVNSLTIITVNGVRPTDATIHIGAEGAAGDADATTAVQYVTLAGGASYTLSVKYYAQDSGAFVGAEDTSISFTPNEPLLIEAEAWPVADSEPITL